MVGQFLPQLRFVRSLGALAAREVLAAVVSKYSVLNFLSPKQFVFIIQPISKSSSYYFVYKKLI